MDIENIRQEFNHLVSEEALAPSLLMLTTLLALLLDFTMLFAPAFEADLPICMDAGSTLFRKPDADIDVALERDRFFLFLWFAAKHIAYTW